MIEKNKIKVGFIFDSYKIPNHYFELLEKVKESGCFEKPVIISGYRRNFDNNLNIYRKLKDKYNKVGALKFVKLLFFIIVQRFIIKVESFYFLRDTKFSNNLIDISKSGSYDFILIKGSYSKSGLVLRATPEDLYELNEAKLDLLVRCGTGILSGEILNVARLGIISIHRGDNRINRGMPAGFWEVLNNESTTGFIIQKINSELDGGEVLVRGNFMTQTTWHKNSKRYQEKIFYFLFELLKEIAFLGNLPKAELPLFHTRQIYKFDARVSILMKYVYISWITLILKKCLKYITRRNLKWQIAYSAESNPAKSLSKYIKIDNQPNSFFADPFAVTFNNRNIIFTEEYFFNEKKGKISAIEIMGDRQKYLGPVIEEKFHLSFPYTFNFGNKLYMVPETAKINEIRIYECVDFPVKWEFKMTLMSDIDAADTMIIREGEYWYLLSNVCSAKIGEHNSELHIYYSESLFTNNWRPITQGNPVIFNSDLGRNGGLYKLGDSLFRVSQVHKIGHYGYSTKINQIESITKERYSERTIQELEPKFFRNQKSFHHFHSNGEFSVLDFQ